jgi:hypothetical protein
MAISFRHQSFLIHQINLFQGIENNQQKSTTLKKSKGTGKQIELLVNTEILQFLSASNRTLKRGRHNLKNKNNASSFAYKM